ncbi:MAG: phosphoribosyl-ATP pyrophosphohydrolase [Candidatus Saccharibacteria bacterium]
MKTQHNKLVRDNIPAVVARAGGTAHIRILNDDEYKHELVRKLDEEVAEFKADLSLEELADIQEVINALAIVIGESAGALEQSRARKAEKRGAFRDKLFLEYTD